MTGEITLQGDILEIGGVKEKVLGAYREGITTIFLPTPNKVDLKDIPEEIKDKITFIFVNNYQDVYSKLFKEKEVVCN